jgi:hypothetical protein
MTADDFRALCLAFPDAVEGFNMGSTFFKVNGKDLARILRDDRAMLTGVPIEEIEMLIEAEPGTFWADAHYKGAKCIVAYFAPFGTDQARPFLERRFRQIAKKAAVKAWEAGA